MYDLKAHGWMVSDPTRMKAYAAAIAAVVKPGDVVADIGAGLGVFAMLACRAGARKVYAIEPSEVVTIAKKMLHANGFASRVEYFQAFSTQVELPERVDVIVADLNGQFCLFGRIIPTIIDMRLRFLKPGGVMIPQRNLMWVAPICNEDAYRAFNEPWHVNSFGLDLSAAFESNVHQPDSAVFGSESVVAKPALWGEFDFAEVQSPDFDRTLRFTIARATPLHGFAVWFDAQLARDVAIRNGPLSENPSYCYRTRFFPLPELVEVGEGAEVELRLRANLVGSEYLWRWDTTFIDPLSPTQSPKRFMQSTFMPELISSEALHRQAGDFRPMLTEEARELSFVLEQMRFAQTIEQISERLVTEFPTRYASARDAFDRVAEMSVKYAR
jgi:type I protein arginine methyltransferase